MRRRALFFVQFECGIKVKVKRGFDLRFEAREFFSGLVLGARWARRGTRSEVGRLVPWLILPVVICLSQRLSHACLSASHIKVKPRMAH